MWPRCQNGAANADPPGNRDPTSGKWGALKNRIILSVLSVAVAGLSFTASGSASALPGPASAASAADQRLDGATPAAAGPARASATGANASGRRKRPRLMPLWRAQNNALDMAEYLYLDPEATWSDYGIGKCTRFSRSRVSCYSYVEEDFFDEYGLYVDTMLCDWFTTSSYNGRGKMNMKIEQPDCVWISEI